MPERFGESEDPTRFGLNGIYWSCMCKETGKIQNKKLKTIWFFFKLLTISRNDVLFMYMNVNKTCLFFVHDTKKASFNMFFANDGFFLSKVNNNRNSKRILAGPSWPKVLPNKTRAVWPFFSVIFVNNKQTNKNTVGQKI